MTAFRDIGPFDATNTSVATSFETRASRRGGRYWIGKTARSAIGHAAKRVVAELDRYPPAAAEESLMGIILDTKDDGTAMNLLLARFLSEITAMQKRLASQNNWEFVAVVSGFNTRDLPLTLGRARVFQFTDHEFEAMRERFLKSDPHAASQIWDCMLNGPGGFQQIIGYTVASVRIRAADAEHARYAGALDLQECLNLWCYGQATFDFTYPFPELKLVTKSNQTFGLCLCLDDPNLPTHQTMGAAVGLPRGVVESAPGWSALANILTISAALRTDLNNRLLVALQWCSNAAFTNADSVRLISIATAFEAIFLNGYETGKTRKLQDRVSRLLGVDDSDRRAVSEFVEEMYDQRSECLHRGDHYVEHEILKRAVTLLSKCIGRLAAESPFQSMKEFQELLDWYDSQSAATNATQTT